MYLLEDCSFVKDFASPVQKNKDIVEVLNKAAVVKVHSKTIDQFDTGDIDLLLLDCEGVEWFTLKRLISRPKLIIIETHVDDEYLNPYLNEILLWMWKHDYYRAGRGKTDTLFINAKK